jgi:metal-responsive CopG/Arc/MetJ family transcriptional regulator
MTKELTIELDERLLEKIEKYAQSRNQDISKFIQDQLQQIVNSRQQNPTIAPVLEEITGILDSDKTSEQLREEYKEHLKRKHT